RRKRNPTFTIANPSQGLKLETDILTRGFVPTDKIKSLAKELDTGAASEKVKELVSYCQKEEQQVKRHLSDRGVEFTDADLAPAYDGPVQRSIEAGSLQDLEQVAAATLDLTTKLKDTQGDNLTKMAADIICRERALIDGL
ncbi:hypothetical protein SBRCBS47491_010016, partial [Sporothrix bragantina]